jgi:hypothetical protein
MRGLATFVLGGLLFAGGLIGLMVAVLSSPIMDLWGRLGTLTISMWPAVLLAIVFLILFLMGVYLMKMALARQG